MPSYRRSVLAILALVIAAVTTVRVQPATYVLAANGNDSAAGTVAAPWRTLSFAVAQLQAGDTLLIRGGTYTGSANTFNSNSQVVRGGTSWANPITISAYPGGLAASTTPGPRAGAEAVTIKAPSYTTTIGLNSSAQQYVIFQDLVIDGSLRTTDGSDMFDNIYISGGANHNRFLHLEVTNATGDGFTISNNNGNAPFNELLYCKIHDNGTAAGRLGYGVYYFTSDNLLEGNDIYNNDGYGVQLDDGGVLAPSLDASRNIIRKNLIHDNYQRSGGDVGGTSGGGLVVASGVGNLVYDNIVYHNWNVANVSDGVGILYYAFSGDTQIYNNTIYDHNLAGIQLQYYDPSNPGIIRNNIIVNNPGGALLDSGDINATFGHFVADHNLTSDPGFVNAAGHDFHLTASSVTAIDQGVTIPVVVDDFDGVTRPHGAGYDIGAYEYVGTVTAPVTPINFQVRLQ